MSVVSKKHWCLDKRCDGSMVRNDRDDVFITYLCGKCGAKTYIIKANGNMFSYYGDGTKVPVYA